MRICVYNHRPRSFLEPWTRSIKGCKAGRQQPASKYIYILRRLSSFTALPIVYPSLSLSRAPAWPTGREMASDGGGLVAAKVEFGTGNGRWTHGAFGLAGQICTEPSSDPLEGFLLVLGTLYHLQSRLPTSRPLTHLACALAGLITRLEKYATCVAGALVGV